MAKTKTQMLTLALRETGKLGTGQTATGALEDEASDAYDQVYNELKQRDLVSWASSSVPDEFVNYVKNMVAFILATGIPADRYQRIASMAAIAPARIAAIINGKFHNPRGLEDF